MQGRTEGEDKENVRIKEEREQIPGREDTSKRTPKRPRAGEGDTRDGEGTIEPIILARDGPAMRENERTWLVNMKTEVVPANHFRSGGDSCSQVQLDRSVVWGALVGKQLIL
ncbi:hypothetical protein NDU88_001191 [Pleurodeles waltl]|uniref:Uncharacterized protein n=1 Tax=Pleurodeles waltl TaxID=8319 RepID=A0AAV7THM6_PLEWA|nr:hypothetical protein NDU88_001191 [Pleurodeles waltl]